MNKDTATPGAKIPANAPAVPLASLEGLSPDCAVPREGEYSATPSLVRMVVRWIREESDGDRRRGMIAALFAFSPHVRKQEMMEEIGL